MTTQTIRGKRGEMAVFVSTSGAAAPSHSFEVAEGCAFVSVLLASAGDDDLRPADARATLRAPGGQVWETTAAAEVADPANVNVETPFGHVLYVAAPRAGSWTVEIDSQEPVLCEIRTMPALEPNGDAEAAGRSLTDFAHQLQGSPIAAPLSRLAPAPEGDTDNPCHVCQVVVITALVAFGLAALVAACLAFAIIGSAALGPVGLAIANALIVVGIVTVVALVVEVLARFVKRILDREDGIFSVIGYTLCRQIRVC